MKGGCREILYLVAGEAPVTLIEEGEREFRVYSTHNLETARFILSNRPQISVLVAEQALLQENWFESEPGLFLDRRVILVGKTGQNQVSVQGKLNDIHQFEGTITDPNVRACIVEGCRARAKENRLDKIKPKDKFLSEDWVRVAAHDMRLPLSMIGSYARMMGEKDGEMTDELKGMLARIQHICDKLQIKLENYLNLMEMEDGLCPVMISGVSISTLLSEAVKPWQDYAGENKVGLKTVIEGEDETLGVDVFKIEQVLQNLIVNGIRFSNPGGEVQVVVENLPAQLVFHVKDQGEGVPSEEKDAIFEKFFRGSNTRGEGNGLGLSIAKALVEMQKGEIWVDSTLNQGATFSFLIPKNPAP